MRNEFRTSTATWLTFFSLGFLLTWLFLRLRQRQASLRYSGPVPPIIPKAVRRSLRYRGY